MAVILRDLGVPTRIAQGFLPGIARQDTRPPRRSCSAMPTPGSRSTSRATAGCRSIRPARLSQIAPLPTGDPAASPPVRSSASAPRASRRRVRRRRPRGQSARPGRVRRCELVGPARGCPGVAPADRRSRRVRGLAARSTRRDDRRRGVRHGDADRVAVRLRAASEPDGLRVRGCPRRCPARSSARSSRRSPGRRSRSVYAREILGDERIQSLQGGPAPAAGQPVEARVPTRRERRRRSARGRRSGCVPRGLPAPFRR